MTDLPTHFNPQCDPGVLYKKAEYLTYEIWFFGFSTLVILCWNKMKNLTYFSSLKSQVFISVVLGCDGDRCVVTGNMKIQHNTTHRKSLCFLIPRRQHFFFRSGKNPLRFEPLRKNH